MANLKDIRRRIKSVKNIRQITKAMELVSAAKMRKAQSAATASRPYSVLSAELLRNLAAKTGEIDNPMVTRLISGAGSKGSDKNLVILMTSDRGLAGAFNANLVNTALRLIRESDGGNAKFDFISIGKKGTDWSKRVGVNLIAAFPGKDKTVTMQDAKPISKIAMDDFLNGKYEKVFIIYPEFISTLVQKPNILQLLPFSADAGGKELEETLFEPSPGEVLENLVVRAVEFVIFQSLLESSASEHSARMVAMRNATESAGDLIEDLTLSANQARQSGITRELSEISAAKLAMEG